MRKIAFALLGLLLSLTASARMEADTDTTTFQGYFYNKEYNVYIRMNAYRANIKVPGQEIFGELPGFFGDNQDGRKWLFTNVEVADPETARLSVVNDYGSEDLEATFRRLPDNTYEFRQRNGSDMKLARNNKWLKLPKVLVFVKR